MHARRSATDSSWAISVTDSHMRWLRAPRVGLWLQGRRMARPSHARSWGRSTRPCLASATPYAAAAHVVPHTQLERQVRHSRPLTPEACWAGVWPGPTIRVTWPDVPWVSGQIRRCPSRLSLSSSPTRSWLRACRDRQFEGSSSSGPGSRDGTGGSGVALAPSRNDAGGALDAVVTGRDQDRPREGAPVSDQDSPGRWRWLR